jgi:hypothetical protein
LVPFARSIEFYAKLEYGIAITEIYIELEPKEVTVTIIRLL